MLKFMLHLPNVLGEEEAMGWIMFFLGMMVGGTVGISVMAIVFYGREPEITADLTKN